MVLILSVYFGFHDSCITFADEKEILLHLEAERVFRKKHIRLNRTEMIELIRIGLDYLQKDISQVTKLLVAKWNNQFSETEETILGKKFSVTLTSHHTNHIGTVMSEKDNAVILVADGGSEDGTTKVYFLENNKLTFLKDLNDTIMTGKFYGTITQMIISSEFGRAHDTYPGKTMGLSALGTFDESLKKLLFTHKEELNKLHFTGCKDLRTLFNISDDYDAPWIDNRRCNFAHTSQKIWEDAFCEELKKYGYLSKNLLISGGCAYNVLLNQRILDEGLFENVVVSPVSGDCGQSIGAIMYSHPNIDCKYPFLGRSFGDLPSSFDITQLVDDLLSEKIVCWYQGRSEVGPRALGHRSFLGIPSSLDMKNKLSVRIKKREPYRPVAPIVLAERVSDFFHFKEESEFMTFAPLVKQKTKELCPAVVHFDDTSRLQTLSRENNPVLYEVLKELDKRIGIPIIMNTSFNVDGEPIVDTPEDAIKTFNKSGADVLYINGDRYEKKI